jgi:hypothetical protein
MSYRVKMLIASALVLAFAGAAGAESVTVTKAVQDACAWEYDKFCNQYGLGSELLDICFKQNARNMTKACVDALVAAGDVSQVCRSAEEAARPLATANAVIAGLDPAIHSISASAC